MLAWNLIAKYEFYTLSDINITTEIIKVEKAKSGEMQEKFEADIAFIRAFYQKPIVDSLLQDIQFYMNVMWYITYIAMPILTVHGTVGNGITMVVLAGKEMSTHKVILISLIGMYTFLRTTNA